jgi:hypothetical protein
VIGRPDRTDSRPAIGARSGGTGAAREQRAEESGWLGRITAAAIGSGLVALAIGIFFSIYAPGTSGLDRAFSGGMMLTLTWPLAMLWILFARTGLGAWGRVLITFMPLMAINAAGLMGWVG